jgi:4-amino-4-deoxy-L-arabinose transferase-like glycosyltransferase
MSFRVPKARLFATMPRPGLIILLGISAALVWLRTWQLLLLPMFHDEALHIARGQYILANHTLLISTVGGKYFQVWLIALILPFADDPLLAARALSAAFGLLAGIGCYLLARHLYQRDDVALAATALYAIAPYPLFFDRMALADGLLSALAIWSLLLSLVVVRQGRWWQVLALGLCLGSAAATKLSGLVFAIFPLLAAWLWPSNLPRRRILLAISVAWLLLIPWLLPAGLDFINQFEYVTSHSSVASEIKGSTYPAQLSQNLGIITNTLWSYLTPLFLALGLVEAGRSLWRRDKSGWLLALAALATLGLFFVAMKADKFYPRYVLPAFPFLLILAARGLAALSDWFCEHKSWPVVRLRWGLLAGLALLASLLALRFDYLLLADPPRAPWMPIDRWQYIDGWPAGYGVTDAAAYLRQRADEMGAIIVVRRAQDWVGSDDWTHYLNQPDISLQAIDFKTADPKLLIQGLRNASAPVFVILDRPDQDRDATAFTKGVYAPYSTLVATFPRPGGASRIEIYQLKFMP